MKISKRINTIIKKNLFSSKTDHDVITPFTVLDSKVLKNIKLHKY